MTDHALFAAQPSQTDDAVVLVLGSPLGLGVLAALLQFGSSGNHHSP